MHFLGNSPPVTLSGPTPSWKLHEGFNTRFENLSSLLDERWDVIRNKISKSSSLHLKHMRLTWQIISGVLIGEWLLFDKLFKTGLHKPVSDVTAATSKSGCWSFLSFLFFLFLFISPSVAGKRSSSSLHFSEYRQHKCDVTIDKYWHRHQ